MRVKNFAGFMKTRMNESMMDDQWEPGSEGSDEFEEGDDATSGYYGANPEEEEEPIDDEEGEEGEGEEELTLEDLKAMIDDLSERLKKLEPEEEGEKEEGEGEEEAEGEEGEENA